MATLFAREKLATDSHRSAGMKTVLDKDGLEEPRINTNVSGFEFVCVRGSTSDLQSKILA